MTLLLILALQVACALSFTWLSKSCLLCFPQNLNAQVAAGSIPIPSVAKQPHADLHILNKQLRHDSCHEL